MKKSLSYLNFAFYRTSSFDDGNPQAVKPGRKSSHRKSSLQKNLLNPESTRRHSWHNEEITTYFLDLGISSKGRIIHIAPVVIVSTPEVDSEHTNNSHQYVNSSVHDVKKERRPSMVTRNFKKIFRK